MNKASKKLIEVEIIKRYVDMMADEHDGVITKYEETDELIQDWDSVLNAPKVDDDGKPVMIKKWAPVKKDLNELSDKERIRIDVLRSMIEKMEELI